MMEMSSGNVVVVFKTSCEVSINDGNIRVKVQGQGKRIKLSAVENKEFCVNQSH